MVIHIFKKFIFFIAIFILAVPQGCNGKNTAASQLIEIRLKEPFNDRNHEYSGLAWFEDRLILLPQYPEGFVMSLKKDQILEYLSMNPKSHLTPERIPINDEGVKKIVPGYEGFEAIVFNGDIVYALIESENGNDLSGYLIRGRFHSDTITLDLGSLVRIDTPVDLNNMAYESLVLWDGLLYLVYEANGININQNPVVPVLTQDFETLGFMPLSHLEYRITDATEPDNNGRFWALNYFWTGDGDLLKPSHERIQIPGYGTGVNKNIERIVEFQIGEDSIKLTDSKPRYISDPFIETGNNWEGIVRFGESGFLVITDKYSRTILGYVE